MNCPCVQGPYKVAFVGSSGVGKTCLFRSMLTGRYEHQTTPTIGVGNETLDYTWGNTLFRLSLWDTGGAEQYAPITSFWLRDANIVLVCFDPRGENYIDDVDKWMKFVQSHCTAEILLVAMKYDTWKEQMTLNSVQEVIAQKLNTVNCIATSALENYQVSDCIEMVIDMIRSASQPVTPPPPLPERGAGKGCC